MHVTSGTYLYYLVFDRFIKLPEDTFWLWEGRSTHNSYACPSPLLPIHRSLCILCIKNTKASVNEQKEGAGLTVPATLLLKELRPTVSSLWAPEVIFLEHKKKLSYVSNRDKSMRQRAVYENACSFYKVADFLELLVYAFHKCKNSLALKSLNTLSPPKWKIIKMLCCFEKEYIK